MKADARRPLALGAVLLLHLLLVAMWLHSTRRVELTVSVAPVSVPVWVRPEAPAETPPPQPVSPPAPAEKLTQSRSNEAPAPSRTPESPRPTRQRDPPTPPAAPAAARPAPEPAAITLPAPSTEGENPVAAAEAPASAPPRASMRDLLHTEGSRRAIEQAARGPLLSEQAAAATGTPLVSAEQKLRDATQESLKGDCAKGEFAGSGGGLLSVPFFAKAVIAGDCAR